LILSNAQSDGAVFPGRIESQMHDTQTRDQAGLGWSLSKPLHILLIAGGALLVWRLSGVILLAFASLLLSITFLAIGDGLRRLAPFLPRRAGTALAFVLLLGGIGGIVAFYGWRIADQYEEIFAKARQGAQAALTFVQAHDWSRALLQKTDGLRIGDATSFLAPVLGSALGVVGSVVGYGAIIIVCGVFMALDPMRYRSGLLGLVPDPYRDHARSVVERIGWDLRRWLVSRLIVMVAIGVLSSIGLLLLGIPAAVTIGVTGAVLTFIPYLGPILAAAPAVLVAFTASPLLALMTGLMFWGVHFIEGTFITPMVQDHEVSLSPVLTILGTLACAVLLGPAGVILASPLILVVRAALTPRIETA
jgi:predicted PurR-regulated permease PerM